LVLPLLGRKQKADFVSADVRNFIMSQNIGRAKSKQVA